MWVWALLRIERVNTHPVCTSVRFSVRANSPLRVGPAVRHGITLEEPRLRLDLIPSSADLDRIAQQW